MSLKNFLPIINQVMGRDFSPELDLLDRGKEAVGRALNQQGQSFVLNNLRGLADFMESPAGKDAIAAFVNAWAGQVLKPPVQLPPPPTEIPEGGFGNQ